MARLDHIEIEGYRSIRTLKLDLNALNILIGANGSGKSNLVGALGLLRDLVDRRLQLHVARQGGAHALLHFGQKYTKRLRLHARFGQNQYEVVLEPAAGDTLVFASERAFTHHDESASHGEDFVRVRREYKESGLEDVAAERPDGPSSQVLKAMRGFGVFQFHDTSATAAMKLKHSIQDNRTLRSDGGNLAALLHGLQRGDPRSYRAIVDTIRAIAPFFEDFVLEPDAANSDMIQLEWRHRTDPSYFGAHSLSDGTLRFMCLATLLLQPARPSLIVIDEPELGLHPAAIVQLAELLRVVSRESQVIVATQSVTLLDQLASQDLIVVERDNGESIFRRLAEDQVRGWLEDYSLGDLWLKNVLGGRPG
jgi:predicted ATPase